MNSNALQVTARSPGSFSSSELEDFIAFVLAGGEVSPNGLKDRVMNAERLAFLREGACLLGVAGLKIPSNNHRHETEKGSSTSLDARFFPFELGWVFVLPSARNRKLSLPLCLPLVEAVHGEGIFATTRTENFGMHRTMEKLGFSRTEAEWPSQRSDGNLLLFIRHRQHQSVS